MFRATSCMTFAVLAALIAVSDKALSADPPPLRPTPVPPAATSSSTGRDELLLAERKLLMEALPRVRKAETLLKTARQQFDRGETSAGLMTLQQILNQQQDTFAWTMTDPKPFGVRTQAVALLASMPNSTLQRYQEFFGAEAGRLLARGRIDGNPHLLDEVSRRFFLTAEGYEATALLAAWWLDHGAPARSAALWDQLLATSIHRERIQPSHRLQAMIAFARCGRANDSHELTTHHSLELPTLSRRDVSFERWLQARAAPADANSIAIGGLVAGGAHRNGIANGTAPVFHQPAWSAPLWRDPNDDLRPVLTAWEEELSDGDGPGAVGQFALCVGQSVVFRDVSGLRAVDVASGRTLWHMPTLASLDSQKFYSRTPALRGPNRYDLKFLDQVLGENTLSGMLASDGQRVYAVDQHEWKPTKRETNMLVAVDIAASNTAASVTRSPLWRIGGPIVEDLPRLPLAGHFFLGPPLISEGLLFALSEFDQQVKLNCLMPHSGEVVWSQTIAVPAVPVTAEDRRYFRAYPLASADGIVICPTPAGVLVAADALTGSLLWAQPCDDIETRTERQRGVQVAAARPDLSHQAFVSLPVISAGRVIYLPPQSTRLQCFDLRSGARLWQTYREEQDKSSEYVATATDDCVLIVGRRCRALRLDTGAEAWSVRFDSWPCGRGVRVGSQFLVPLARGAISQLDLTTGRQVALIDVPPDHRLGNLVVDRDVLVSMGPTYVTAFPRAEPMRRRLLAEIASTAEETATPDRILDLTALDSLNGFHAAAYRRLNQLLSRPLTTSQRTSAETALRHVLLTATSPEQVAQWQRRRESAATGSSLRATGSLSARAASEPSAESTGGRATRATPDVTVAELPLDRWFELLEQWSANQPPADRLETMMRRAAWEHARGDWRRLADLSAKIADLDLSTPWSPPDDPARRVSAVRWLADRVAREQPKLDDESLVSLLAYWDAELDHATHAPDSQPLKHLLAAASGWPQAETARTRLAARWQELGQPQAAELLLLENRRGGAPGSAAEATRLLIELWSEEGLYDPAARLLRELGTRYADVPLGGGKTGRDFVAQFPRGSLTWSAYRRLAPREWPTAHVAIREERWYDDRLHRTYNSSRLLGLPASSSFDLFDRGRTGGSELVVVDRVSGAERTTIPVSSGYSHVLSPMLLDSGHLVPLGARGALQGVSLLEGRVVWSTSPSGRYDRDTVPRVGPSGPNFCTFQNDSHLFVLDPTNGQVLWQRNDLEPSSGLVADTYSGLFGDAEVLIVFAKDRATYTLYRTATGEEISRGRLDINPAMTRRVNGRRLLHFTSSDDERRVRLWDPLASTWLVDEPVASLLNGQARPIRVPRGQQPAGTTPCLTMSTDDLVFVTTDGRLRIYDLQSDEWRVDLNLPPHLLSNVETVRVFRDHARYYVGLTPSASQDSSQNQFFASDVMIPVTHLHGTLIAVSRPEGRSDIPVRYTTDKNVRPTEPTLLWEQRLQSCSILNVADPPLPFLIVLCRERILNQLSLRVELRDVTTGDVIVGADQLYPDRIVQFSADPDQRLIELIGSKSTVRVEFADR